MLTPIEVIRRGNPFLSILRETASLRDPPQPPSPSHNCSCGNSRLLKVICVYFERLKEIELRVCPCAPAAHQLMQRALFPCAPVFPTLAVDLSLLKFVKSLFLRLPPNMTGWCEALEEFLESRGYRLGTQLSLYQEGLRRRFSNALRWYTVLRAQTEKFVQTKIDDCRPPDQVLETRASSSSPTSLPPPPPPSPSPDPRSAPTVPDEPDEAAPAVFDEPDEADPAVPDEPDEEILEAQYTRASAYLRMRCPLCFGGEMIHTDDDLPDKIFCCDANFTQKRRKGQSDHDNWAWFHPDTVFISESKIAEMEEQVAAWRANGRGKQRRRDGATNDPEEDHCEDGMAVPNSVLDGCQESFTAADEKREKASTKFFRDTGIMALLCRHDRVLFLANMTSAGEKQHYVLALVKELFQHLPKNITIGLLYDVSCFIHRSCVKHGFIPELLDRITFALAVFHAYGHQWPCQLIYHPRKCKGFGLSDGEGCERFWSLLKKLIPPLRVSGYHQRLLVLDEQVKYLDTKSLLGLGMWLNRRWQRCESMKREAEDHLLRDGVDMEVLKAEWEAQVRTQTKPAPRRTQKEGQKAVEAILALQKLAETYRTEERELQKALFEGDNPIVETQEKLSAVRQARADIETRTKRLRSALGVDNRLRLDRLIKDQYLQLRMSARALKTRIRNRVRDRKFEFERLERAYRNVLNDKKLSNHIRAASKRRDPSIIKLVSTYNSLVTQIVTLIGAGKAPRGAKAPSTIDRTGLFELDVDDAIWEDVPDDDSRNSPALWQSDEDVRRGIRLMHQLDRCTEEESHLRQERCALQEWFMEEWECTNRAFEIAENDPDLQYQLSGYRSKLSRLCSNWQGAVSGVPCSRPLPESWGLSQEEVAAILATKVTGSFDLGESEDDIVESDNGSECGEDNAEFIEEIEVQGIVDAYQDQRSDSKLEDADKMYIPSTPKKRRRRD
ncbi:hypothetical protein NLI96_g12591 [Meripilus lineatus]|uniref:CxC1-like cysteine cluster associated with KDZ transposases domain-containing protein n=1 Tax=Meripilus lineatus TaxID=2056292 RepID=A0AAD5Y820_9APHY|nr:hypothetical protein NLI96_g12591 [Physisporinus lineatus]